MQDTKNHNGPSKKTLNTSLYPISAENEVHRIYEKYALKLVPHTNPGSTILVLLTFLFSPIQ